MRGGIEGRAGVLSLEPDELHDEWLIFVFWVASLGASSGPNSEKHKAAMTTVAKLCKWSV